MRLSAQLDFFGGPRLPAMIQSEAAECGLACLAMVATFHGREVDLTALRRLFSVSLKGVTLKDVLAMGQRLGMTGRGLRLEPEQLGEIKLPCILHWDMNHFVVLKTVSARTVTIHDPAVGVRTLTLDEVGRHFTGIALELTPTGSFERRKETSRLSLTALWGRMPGIKRALAQALVLSAVLQLVVLAAPFYMQLAVDEAVMKGDGGLLTALALGFGLLTLVHIGADWLRSHVLLFLSGALNFQMGANLFHHLVRLPLAWFEKRHIGDLVSRFRSAEPIQRLISEGLVAALVDGVMAILTLVMILIYSPKLSGIVLAALVLYGLLRFALYRALRQRQEEMIEAAAKEQTTFIETARAIQSIKIFGREADREALWQNRYADEISRGIRHGRFTIGFKTANDLIYGIENVLVVYLGARAIMAGELSIGMLYAFMAYKEQFLSKATNLIETGIQYRMLDLHLDRLSDIALAEREQDRHGESLVPREVRGAVELEGVSFRYADTEPEVLSGANLKVEAGEFVAVTGPSGGGKTTLLKIMLGLFKPMEGTVLIDGTPLEHFGTRAFRSQVGVVMQDDQLLSGSIAENIGFFDATLDLDWMRACAEAAGIDDEIMAMPMNYNTLIGDMGTTLSGGQRQRVLLARALYRRPRILFMDEGTSNLDLDKEREVNRALAELKITRIVIAHRPETIRAADRIVVLREGRVSPPMDGDALAFTEAARHTTGLSRA
ncbi:peptidase domain-containing ABC transporter [Microvirga aerilata]|uniref:Peptidase domain-containing ABC transporter n=2 Tax=Microvirga aerilata TaxID=670292 RepID=A0A937CXH1_9HYPH|nr:peptidase domain-containing ABC transporter [Microvirga aerilata]MBL0405448.1 peptidase domain-containing ABC transporter [Microvirga aerilata]